MEDSRKIDEITRSALERFFVKDYHNAISELKSAEVIDRDNPEILYNIGIAYCRIEFYNAAIEYFNRVLSLKLQFVDSMQVKKLIAYSLIKMEKYSKALEYLNQIDSPSLKDIQIMSMAGYCYEKKGDYEKALQLHKDILKIDKKNLNSVNACAYIMAHLNIDLENALKLANYACSIERNNPAFLDTLGFALIKAGKIKEAEIYLKKAEQIMPFSEDIKNHLEELKKLK